MQLPEASFDEPQISVKPMAYPIMSYDPISAFLALSSIIIPFLLWENTFLAYALIVAPIYLLYKSQYLVISLLIIAIFWPQPSQKNIFMRLFIVMNATYIFFTRNKEIKYKITPNKVENSLFPIII